MSGFMNLPNEPPVILDDNGRSSGEPYPLFTRISIETISYCNRDCVFCPLHWSAIERGRKAMTEDLYGSIVRQLGELEFSGVVQLFLLSEPTIDASIQHKLMQLRLICPDVTIYASSNGDVFDSFWRRGEEGKAVQKILDLYDAGLTVLNLNVYDSGEAQALRYRAIYDRLLLVGVKPTENKYRKHNPRQRYVALTDMRLDQNDQQGLTNVLYIKTKAERAHITAPQIHCARPQRHLVIEYDGNVPICCAIDVTDKTLPSMGNVNTQSLLDIWNGEPMNRYRFFTQQKKRILPGCATCTHRMAFPAIVRKVEPDEETQKLWEHR